MKSPLPELQSLLTRLISQLARHSSRKLSRLSNKLDPSNKSLDLRFRLYQQAVEQCPVSIVITDAEGVIEYVNPMFESLTGYSREEAVGESPRILNSRTQPTEIYKDLWETICAGETWRGELHNLKQNGDPFWEMATISPLKDTRGRITHFVAVKEDITKQRAQTEKLEDAYQKAKAADVAKSAFLATMSHELRTPLNTIIGLAALLIESEPLGQNAERSVGYIQRSGEQLLGMIENLLQLSKIQEDKSQASFSSFALLPLLCDVVQSCASQAAEKNIILQTDFDPDLPSEIESEPAHLRQCLSNLLSNAVKYTEYGYARLIVKKGPAQEIHFSVIDTGLGISKENQKSIFDAFYQIDGSNRRKHGGVGLGLAICQSFVDRLGGELSLESELGRGSNFTLRIPLRSAEKTTKLFTALRKPEFEGLKITTLLDPSLFQSCFRNIAECCAWKITERSLHDFEESEIPADTQLILAEKSLQSQATDVRRLPKGIPILWRNHNNAPSNRREISSHPIPDQIFASVTDALSSSPCKESPDVQAPASTPKLADSIPLKILVVDDIAPNRTVAKMILKHIGYDPSTVDGGIAFVDTVRKQSFDFVLLDLQMPDLDGASAFAQLQKDPPAHGLPKVVALTADSQDKTRQACLKQGMDGYLTKPMNPKKIADCIYTLFEEKEAPAAEQSNSPILDHDHLATLVDSLNPQEAAMTIEQCARSLELDASVCIEKARVASRVRQSESLIPIVHGLKGGFCSLGWKQAGDFCQLTLQELRADSFEAFDELPDKLEAHVQAASAEINKFLKQLKSKDTSPRLNVSK